MSKQSPSDYRVERLILRYLKNKDTASMADLEFNLEIGLAQIAHVLTGLIQRNLVKFVRFYECMGGRNLGVIVKLTR